MLVTQLASKKTTLSSINKEILDIDNEITNKENELKKIEGDILISLVNQQRFIVQLIKSVNN